MTTPQDSTNTTERDPTPSGSPPQQGRRAPGAGGQSTMPPRRTWLWFALILLANFLLVRLLFPGPEAPISVPYTFFKEQVSAGNVEAIFSRGDTVEGRFEKPVTYPPKGEGGSEPGSTPSRTSETFTTVLPAFVIPDPALEQFLIDNGVQITAEPIQEGGSLWQTLLFAFGPALLLIGGYIWLYRRAQQQGGGMGGALTGVGRSRARRYDQESETRVTFDDVAGIDEAENELIEIVEFLKDPGKYTRLGGAAPKGVLLVGAPGTGKTLLARALLERETLDEEEILEVTGLPPAPPLENRKVPVPDADSRA
jgi:cell division protease FtsH